MEGVSWEVVYREVKRAGTDWEARKRMEGEELVEREGDVKGRLGCVLGGGV